MKKLVRDKIPSLLRKAGVRHVAFAISPEERLVWLIEKLREETEELRQAPSLEECADVYEVLMAIARELGFGVGDVQEAADAKNREKGGFAEGLVVSFDN